MERPLYSAVNPVCFRREFLKDKLLAELEGATAARWKAQFTFNFAFTDLSAIPLTKRGVTSWSEKMLFSAHSTLKKSNHRMFKVSV